MVWISSIRIQIAKLCQCSISDDFLNINLCVLGWRCASLPSASRLIVWFCAEFGGSTCGLTSSLTMTAGVEVQLKLLAFLDADSRCTDDCADGLITAFIGDEPGMYQVQKIEGCGLWIHIKQIAVSDNFFGKMKHTQPHQSTILMRAITCWSGRRCPWLSLLLFLFWFVREFSFAGSLSCPSSILFPLPTACLVVCPLALCLL